MDAAAATAPTRDTLRTPPAYYRAFEADTHSIFIINELRSFLTLQNYNDFELQLSHPAYERAESYLESASNRMSLLRPEFTPDGDGGIDIEWETQGRLLVLSCRKNADEDFISWRQANGRYEGDRASQSLLDQKLDWLIS